jgi:hypothetical protein
MSQECINNDDGSITIRWSVSLEGGEDLPFVPSDVQYTYEVKQFEVIPETMRPTLSVSSSLTAEGMRFFKSIALADTLGIDVDDASAILKRPKG